MTIDQPIDFWAMIGTWFAGAGTLAAATVALWLARRTEKVELRVWAGRRFLVPTSSPQEFISIEVTNCGERPITVTGLVFRAGRPSLRRDRRQVGLLPEDGWKPQDLPCKIEYGESVSFRMDFAVWAEVVREKVLQDIPRKDWKTVRVLIVTSVGHTEVVALDRDAWEQLMPPESDVSS